MQTHMLQCMCIWMVGLRDIRQINHEEIIAQVAELLSYSVVEVWSNGVLACQRILITIWHDRRFFYIIIVFNHSFPFQPRAKSRERNLFHAQTDISLRSIWEQVHKSLLHHFATPFLHHFPLNAKAGPGRCVEDRRTYRTPRGSWLRSGPGHPRRCWSPGRSPARTRQRRRSQ